MVRLVSALVKFSMVKLWKYKFNSYLLHFFSFATLCAPRLYYQQVLRPIFVNLNRLNSFLLENLVSNSSVEIQLRQFNFKRFPPHTNFLKNYAWKIIINTIMSRCHELVKSTEKLGRLMIWTMRWTVSHNTYLAIVLGVCRSSRSRIVTHDH